MYNVIGIDADVSCGCGTAIPVVQDNDKNGKWCWLHHDGRNPLWYPKTRLSEEIALGNFHPLDTSIPFNQKQSDTPVFVSTEFLDFNRIGLPKFFSNKRCCWECLSGVQPYTLVTCTSLLCSMYWLDDLARMTAYSIDRHIRKPSDAAGENAMLRRMAGIAIRIANDQSIVLNLHIRICAFLIDQEEIYGYFCDHVAEKHHMEVTDNITRRTKRKNVEFWDFKEMILAHIEKIGSLQHAL